MNREIKKIIEKNRHRSAFYQHKKIKKQKPPKLNSVTNNPVPSTNKTENNKYLTSLVNKVMISIILFLVLLISKKDEKLNIIYKNTFKNMNIVQIENFVTKRFSGIFPTPDNEDKYVNAPIIKLDDMTAYREGVTIDLGIGAPVQSSVEGRVIRMYQDEDLGKVVVIQDVHGYEYHYGYLDNIDVRLFENIEYGQIIGIGKTDEYFNTYFYLAIMDGDDALDVVSIISESSYDGIMWP